MKLTLQLSTEGGVRPVLQIRWVKRDAAWVVADSYWAASEDRWQEARLRNQQDTSLDDGACRRIDRAAAATPAATPITTTMTTPIKPRP